jgi:uridine kinase
VLCAHDPLTGIDHREVTVESPTDAVLIVEGIFAFRPEYNDLWDYRIWLEIAPEPSLKRGINRDVRLEGRAEAERLHRDRYHAAGMLYLSEVNPISIADLVIDNADFANQIVQRRRGNTG